MKKLLATLCLTIAVILGNVKVSESAEPIDGVCLPKTKHYHLPISGKCSAAYEAGDYGTAPREFRPLAEQGYPDAQFELGLMYKHGAGVPKDNKEAMKWFKLAAELGYSDAKLIIAAENGDKNAAFRLGGMYSGTLGGGDDFPEDR